MRCESPVPEGAGFGHDPGRLSMVRSMLRSLLCSLPGLICLSCSTVAPEGAPARIPTGHYDSAFPAEPVSVYLEQIVESILRMNTVAYYKMYTFGQQERVRVADLTPAMFSSHENTSVYTSASTSGTATVVYSLGRKIALLTCAHVVAFPDTTYSYLYGPEGRATEFLSTVSIQKRTALYVASLPEAGTVELLAINHAADLAVVGHTYEADPGYLPPVIRHPLGRSKDLEWGTFTYLFGYPSGNRVVTKGIVSSPNKDRNHSFLVDAVFGRGFSGGICCALRDGVPNFEIVGLIKMVPARTYYVVTPGKDRSEVDISEETPYHGELFVDRRTEIDYGVTQAISAEIVREFLTENRGGLEAKGFPLDKILKESGGS
jgi:hypothetical protein